VIEIMGNGRNQNDGWRLLEMYQKLGLKLESEPSSEESGVYEVCQRMSAGKLQVFRNLANFFQEYRVYRRNEHGHVIQDDDQLMNCLRYLCVSGRRRMQTEPIPTFGSGCLSYGGPRSWMS
jgi:hypothetical protein